VEKSILSRYFNLVEIRTKLASLLPFLLGLMYVRHAYGTINGWNTAIFFLAMLCFDMMTTALNNYIDTKTNNVPLAFSRPVARLIMLVLLALATALGLLLVWRTSLVVLAAGVFCFFMGIAYTAGPAPISRMPLGEAFSGFVMGFFIPFLTIYINAPLKQLVFYSYAEGVLDIGLRLPDLLRLALLTVPAITGIANIMLANNTCDLENDRRVNRFTLPHYIGVPNALRLFAALYALAFISIALLVLLKILPWHAAFALLAAIPVARNVRKFFAVQSKPETFPLSVMNLNLILIPLIILIAV